MTNRLDLPLQSSSGTPTTLREHLGVSPLTVVFLRHLGCTFCREHVRALQSMPVESIVFITTAEPEAAERFRSWIHSPHVFLSDPSAELFDAFGVARGEAGQLFSPTVIARGFVSLLRGNINGLPAGDPMRLGGTFVLTPSGEVAWSHVAADASDNASLADIQAAISAVGGATAAVGPESRH